MYEVASEKWGCKGQSWCESTSVSVGVTAQPGPSGAGVLGLVPVHTSNWRRVVASGALEPRDQQLEETGSQEQPSAGQAVGLSAAAGEIHLVHVNLCVLQWNFNLSQLEWEEEEDIYGYLCAGTPLSISPS